jgi:hypothetical protein
VLREVRLVECGKGGREWVYRLNGRPLKSIHDWVKSYEQTWNERLDALDDLLENLAEEETTHGSDA